MKNNKRLAMPDAIFILFALLIMMWIASFIIPSGQFDTEPDSNIVIPGSFTQVDSNPIGIMELFLSIQNGLIGSANLIFLVLIIGGAIAVIEAPGTINAGVKALVDKTKGRIYFLIGIISVVFGIISTLGMSANAVIAFIPLGIILARALDLDAIAGISIIYLGYYAGQAAAVFDPIILGVAQEIAGVPIFSGYGLRILVFITLLIATILYVFHYVKKIKKDPSKSIMGDQKFADKDLEDSTVDIPPFSFMHVVIVLIFFFTIGLFVYGSLELGWGINELAALFLINAILTGIVSKQTPNSFVKTFMSGAKNILYGALIIGIASSIVVLMKEAMILDTIVNAIFIPLSYLSPIFGAIAMFIFNLILNILIPSGSGQASVAMPLMTPLADLLGVTRQTAVLAFKLGDGVTNMITPISGVLMAVLAVGGVPYTKWIKYIMPLVGIWTLIGLFYVVLAVFINYGPI